MKDFTCFSSYILAFILGCPENQFISPSGLCGNCNGRVEDDYLTPNGKNVRNHINADAILGHSWRVKNAEDGEDEK